jgi:hypothetical protein
MPRELWFNLALYHVNIAQRVKTNKRNCHMRPQIFYLLLSSIFCSETSNECLSRLLHGSLGVYYFHYNPDYYRILDFKVLKNQVTLRSAVIS